MPPPVSAPQPPGPPAMQLRAAGAPGHPGAYGGPAPGPHVGFAGGPAMGGAPAPGAHAVAAPGGPAGPRASRRGLAIGIGAAVVAAAGAAIAAVLLLRGSEGGAASRDELVRRALAAATAGDVDALVKLGDPVEVRARLLDCSGGTYGAKTPADGSDRGSAGGGGPEDDDPELAAKRLRRQHENLVAAIQARKLELVAVEAEREARPQRKGARATRGCVVARDVVLHSLLARVQIEPAGGGTPEAVVAVLRAVEAGDRWYLAGGPTLRATGKELAASLGELKAKACACADAACARGVKEEAAAWARKRRDELAALARADRDAVDAVERALDDCAGRLINTVGRALDDMERIRAKMCACADGACADRVAVELAAWSKAATALEPTPEESRRAERILASYTSCAEKARATVSDGATGEGGAVAAAGDGDAAAAARALSAAVPECAAYQALLERIAACGKYPEAHADAARGAYATLAKTWSDVRGVAAAREQFARSCKAMSDATRASVDQLCD